MEKNNRKKLILIVTLLVFVILLTVITVIIMIFGNGIAGVSKSILSNGNKNMPDDMILLHNWNSSCKTKKGAKSSCFYKNDTWSNTNVFVSGNWLNNKFLGPSYNSKKDEVAYFEISAGEDTNDINGNTIPKNTWMVYVYEAIDVPYNTLYRICIDGIYTRRIRAVYNDGTYSNPRVYTIKVDKTAPDIPTSSVIIDNVSYTGVSSYDAGTTSSNITWNNFNSQDNLSGILRYEYSTNCKSTKVSSINTRGYTYKTTTSKKYCIRAVDNAGNYSEWSNPYYFKIDKSIPSSMTLNATKVRLNLLKDNKTHKIEVNYPEGISSKSKAVTYKTSNSKVAAVSTSGVITAVGKGTTTITVTNKSNKSLYAKVTVEVIKRAGVLIGDSKTVQLGGGVVTAMDGNPYSLNYNGYNKSLNSSTVKKSKNLYFIAKGGQGYLWLSEGIVEKDVEENSTIAGEVDNGGFIRLKSLLKSAMSSKTFAPDTDFYVGISIGGNNLKDIGYETSVDYGDKCQVILSADKVNWCKNQIDTLAKKYVDLYYDTMTEINKLRSQNGYKGEVYFKVLSDLPVTTYTRENGTKKTCESEYYYGKKTNSKVAYFNERIGYYIKLKSNSRIQYVDIYSKVKSNSRYQLIDGVHFTKDTAQFVLDTEMSAIELIG